MRKQKEEVDIIQPVQYVFSFIKDGPQCQHVEKGRCSKCESPLKVYSSTEG